MKFFYLILAISFQTLYSAPVENNSTSTSTTTEISPSTTTTSFQQKPTDVYDQSQNGTENYKLKVKGFTFLLAPSDALLGAAMMLGGLNEDSDMKLPTQLNETPSLRTVQPHSKFSKLLQLLKKFN